MEQLLGSSITYRIAVGPQQGRKVFTLQTLPACDEPFDVGRLPDRLAALDDEEAPASHALSRSCASVPILAGGWGASGRNL